MPWEIQKQDNQYCVVKQGESDPVPGGCHESRADAVKHMRALYAAEPQSTMKYSILNFADIEIEDDAEDPNTKWLKAWRYSKWEHPKYGTIEITPDHGQRFKQHFDNGSLGRQHLVNYNHGEDAAKGNKSGGEVLAIDPREDGIWYKVNFTNNALQEIQDREWRYISPEYGDWENPETGEVFEDMPFDIALCNTPFFKGQQPLNFSELYTEEAPDKEFSTLTAAARNNLKDSDFLYIDKNGERHLPVHDLAHVRAAISRLSQPGTGTGKDAWLTESLRSSLLAKARKKLASLNGKKGGSAVDELLRQFADKLDIQLDDDMDEDAILAKADELNNVIAPLRDAKVESEGRRAFREAFPEEYKRMKKLEESTIDQNAKSFSENYRRFTIKVGEKEYKSSLGFSELVIEEIEAAHKKCFSRSMTESDLKQLLDRIADKGTVDFSEHGSSRTSTKEWDSDPKVAFSEAIKDIMEQDDMAYENALNVAKAKHPDLYEAYMRAIPQR